MKSLLKIVAVFTLIIACSSNNNTSENKSIIVNKKDKIEVIPSTYIDTSFITEENVWVRSSPVNGEQLGKLSKGTKCYILERGASDSIRGVTDYWYKVMANGVEGWVFGSQLSVKISQLIAFEKTLGYFLEAYNRKNIETLNDYVHPQYGISFGYVVCDKAHSEEGSFTDVKSYPDFISFDTLQEFSSAFPNITCKNPNHTTFPTYLGNMDWSEKGCFWQEFEKGEVKLVSTKTIYEFYFKAIESNWFLVRIEKLDCE